MGAHVSLLREQGRKRGGCLQAGFHHAALEIELFVVLFGLLLASLLFYIKVPRLWLQFYWERFSRQSLLFARRMLWPPSVPL